MRNDRFENFNRQRDIAGYRWTVGYRSGPTPLGETSAGGQAPVRSTVVIVKARHFR